MMSCYDVDLIFIIILNFVTSLRMNAKKDQISDGYDYSLPPAALRFLALVAFILFCANFKRGEVAPIVDQPNLYE